MELLQLLKNELFITWDDVETTERLVRIISNAIPTMNYKLGANIDYSINGMEQTLFLNYCVYYYNNCVEEFDNNYLHEINQIRLFYEVNNEKK